VVDAGTPPGEAPGRPGRLVGLDVARCLALLGMVATHVLDERSPDGSIAPLQWLAGGRASALFAVLAGVSLALMTGRREPVRGQERVRRSAGLALRALLIAAVGLVLGELETGIAVILTYYGVLFLAGLPFLGLRARTLGVLAAVWAVVVPVASHLVRPELPERGTASPTVAQLADPWQLGTELLLTGYYPVLPWLAYLLVGIALGRADLRSSRLLAALTAGGGALAVAATGVSRVLTAQSGRTDRLLADEPAYGTGEELFDSIATGMLGTTPTGTWEWLLVVAPHSGTPFDLAQTIGSALAVVGGCLLVLHGLPALGRLGVAVLFGAGTMTLTLYSLHVVMRSPWVWPPEEPDTFRWHVLVLLTVGALYAAFARRGPLERVATWLSRLPGGREPPPVHNR
jgi:uncharacterized membrane protein